jgi:hypothetical protein
MSDMFGFGFGIPFPENRGGGKRENVKPGAMGSSTDRKIVISRDEFQRRAAEVIRSGKFTQMSMEKDPMMGAITMMMGSILVSELEAALFGDEEDKDNG